MVQQNLVQAESLTFRVGINTQIIWAFKFLSFPLVAAQEISGVFLVTDKRGTLPSYFEIVSKGLLLFYETAAALGDERADLY